MNLTFENEQMAPYFQKWHIHGLPFPISFNEFSEPDASGEFHNHPFSFRTTIEQGGYREQVVTLLADGGYTMETFDRLPGTTNHVQAGTIHSIVELLDGPCITQMRPDVNETVNLTDWQMWKFIDGKAWFRPENKGDWRLYKHD